MSSRESRYQRRQDRGETQKPAPIVEMEQILGSSEDTRNVIKRLSTGNGGDRKLVFRELNDKLSREQLTSLINSFVKLQYMKAKDDYEHHNREGLRKDLLSAKFVIDQYSSVYSVKRLDTTLVENLKSKIEEMH